MPSFLYIFLLLFCAIVGIFYLRARKKGNLVFQNFHKAFFFGTMFFLFLCVLIDDVQMMKRRDPLLWFQAFSFGALTLAAVRVSYDSVKSFREYFKLKRLQKKA